MPAFGPRSIVKESGRRGLALLPTWWIRIRRLALSRGASGQLCQMVHAQAG